MLILITGKNNSGKSAFAEKLATNFEGNRYYIATMRPNGEEGEARVNKHRRQRAGLGFETLELPCTVANAKLEKKSVVLLEDVSNLLANAMFEKRQDENAVFRDIMALSSRCENLLAVTISKFKLGEYNEETREYIAALYRLNDRLFAAFDTVYEMRDGEAVLRRGQRYDLD